MLEGQGQGHGSNCTQQEENFAKVVGATSSESFLLTMTIRSFVHLFILCGQKSSLLWTPAPRPFESVQPSPGSGGELIGVRTVWCARYVE